MLLFVHTLSVLLWLVLPNTAYGQLSTTTKENSQGNVTVQSVQMTAPSQDGGQYVFTFNMSSGEELIRDGKLREVNGKREVVMTGYIKETVNGETHWLRYVADENGHNVMVARRIKAGQLDGNLPSFNIQPDESGLQNRFQTTVSPHGSTGQNPPVNDSVRLQSETDLDRLQPLPCTPFFHLCIPKMDQVLEALIQNYDKQIRPGFYDQPTQVWADFHIRGLLEIDEVDMEFKVSVALTLDWLDDRLKLHGTSFPKNFIFPNRVLVDAEQAQRIWTPQVTVLNEKESVEYSDIFDKGSLFWNPYNGQLIVTKYGVLTLTCHMSLQNFPMDTQICSVMVGSNVYGKGEIDLVGNVALDPIFSNFVTNMELIHYGERGYVAETESGGVNQTILVCDLLMKRHVGYYLIGTYFPAALVVIISWLTFWMPREGSAERMALGVTCVLTITTLLISSQSSSPKVSYVKAIDIYMVVCFGLIFATLLQSTFIGYLLRKSIISDGCKSKVRGDIEGVVGLEHNSRLTWVVKRILAGEMEVTDEAKILKLLKMSDAWSRILFPLLFVVFNVTYWAYYGTVWNELGESRNWRDPVKRGISMQVHSWFGENDM